MASRRTAYRIPRTMHWVARPARLLVGAFIGRELRNLHNVPTGGGVVMCGNHVSAVDPVTYAWTLYDLGVPFKFLAKDSMFKWPLVGAMMRGLEQIPVARGTKDAARSLVAAVDIVKSGNPVMVFPEGTLTKQPDLWPMRGHTGAAKIALTSGAPVVPMAQWGQQEIMRDGGRVPKLFPRKHVVVTFGEPVDLDDLRDKPLSREVLKEATERIMWAITDLVQGLRGGTPPTALYQHPLVKDTK
ncbi:1-acyl-sn-glycerol-3-phosphate acyltransferase [Micrococcales bacterium 31B]|nr:1-acyl-sn-glycerol-3-phosphate acyltransferase [Micrococcales bacterium 31B]